MIPSISSVLRVGEGRGFVVSFRVKHGQKERYCKIPQRDIVTAAHCLPKLPPPDASSYLQERTYQNLVGVLGAESNVWAECLYVDPVADIAVLGCPDDQALYEQADAYLNLVKSVKPFVIGEPETGNGWLLSLGQPYRWLPTPLDYPTIGCLLTGPTLAGMSGSPILNHEGRAVAVVNMRCENGPDAKALVPSDRSGPQSILKRNLPGWLL
jgi:Trypsin-like peptidase domain